MGLLEEEGQSSSLHKVGGTWRRWVGPYEVGVACSGRGGVSDLGRHTLGEGRSCLAFRKAGSVGQAWKRRARHESVVCRRLRVLSACRGVHWLGAEAS